MIEAKVARIGRKDDAREELPPTVWHRHLKALARFFLLALVGWFFFGLALTALVVQ